MRLGLVVDIGQLPLGRGRRHRLLLAVGEPGHLQLDFGLGHKRADFRQAEAGAKAIKGNHVEAPDFLSSRFRLSTPCCHRGVSSGAHRGRRDRGRTESSWTKSSLLECCPGILTPCCQPAVSIGKAASEKETRHETRRPAVSDHSGAPAHPEAADGGCHRGRAGDLEAHDLPRHRNPDRTAGADPRRGRHGLHPGEGIRPAALDAHARRNRGGGARRVMGGRAMPIPCWPEPPRT